MTNLEFKERVKDVFYANGYSNIIGCNFIEKNKACLIFTYEIEVFFSSKPDFSIQTEEFDFIAKSKKEALIVIQLVIEAKNSYNKKFPISMIEVHKSNAIDKALSSRKNWEYNTLEFHEWTFIMNDIINLQNP